MLPAFNPVIPKEKDVAPPPTTLFDIEAIDEFSTLNQKKSPILFRFDR